MTTVFEYLNRFTQYAARVQWDEKAKKSQFYERLKPQIKNAMMIIEYPDTLEKMIAQATRIEDNIERRKLDAKERILLRPLKKNPDAIN